MRSFVRATHYIALVNYGAGINRGTDQANGMQRSRDDDIKKSRGGGSHESNLRDARSDRGRNEFE